MTVRGSRGRWALLVLVVVFAAAVVSSRLSGRAAAEGVILISSADLQLRGNALALNARADVQLTPRIRDGLDSGVPLQFIIELTVRRVRRLWLDPTVVNVQHRYSLIYYELTRHYRLQSLDTGHSRNFRSLLAALEALGSLRGLALTMEAKERDALENALQGSLPLRGELHMRLDDGALPLPLQSTFSSAWRLSSEEYVWPIN